MKRERVKSVTVLWSNVFICSDGSTFLDVSFIVSDSFFFKVSPATKTLQLLLFLLSEYGKDRKKQDFA